MDGGVYNRYKIAGRVVDNQEYIGRGSKWGNPFRIIPNMQTREQVLRRFEVWLAQQDHLLAVIDELRGKNLVCFCKPAACHGDLLRYLANTTDENRLKWKRAVLAGNTKRFFYAY